MSLLGGFFQIDEGGFLFISPAIKEWPPLAALGIDTVIDLEGDLDACIPTVPGECLYIYFPMFDEDLPDLDRLDAVAGLGARQIETGHRVLSHCGAGFNRSALVAGAILHKLGHNGEEIVARIRAKRPGALFNDMFADYLLSLT